jgi:hypothetical protein
LAACTSDSTANSFNGQSVSHQDTKNPVWHSLRALLFLQPTNMNIKRVLFYS